MNFTKNNYLCTTTRQRSGTEMICIQYFIKFIAMFYHGIGLIVN